MKKMTLIVAALLTLALVFAGCGSKPATSDQSGRVPGNFPDFVKDALMNVPEDVLVGIGVAKLASISQSMTISANRARADISRQMSSVVQDMIRDYQASSEVDPQAAISFQENITVTLSKAELTGARVVKQDQTQDGNVWTVVWMDKSSVVNEISQAQSAARLAVPAMASFSAEARMNEAFARQAAQEYQINDR